MPCLPGTKVSTSEQRLVERAKNIRIGDPLNPATNFGPLVRFQQMQKVLGYLDVVKAEGACLLVGGERMNDAAFASVPLLQPRFSVIARMTGRSYAKSFLVR